MHKLALIALMLAVGSSAAQARHRHHGRHHTRHHHYAHHWAYHGLSGACRQAAAMGGPCGCVAEELIFGRSDHVLGGRNLWLAQAWLGFPRSAPGPGKAAVWPHRHVEAVVRTNGDGTITTNGPYGMRRVRLASVVIVNPHGSKSRRTSSID